MLSLASVGLALSCLLGCAVSQSLQDASRTSIVLDRGPSGLNLSPGAELFIANKDGKFDSTIAQRWSDFQNPTFFGIVVVANENDIINTIKFATKNKIPFLTLGGTHGYSTTLSKVQNGIAIDLRKSFVSVSVNSAANTATVGGAALIQDLVNAAHGAGKQTPTGTCPCVGILGAALGGGIGRLQGMHGLMSDNIISARMVLANGNAVTVSATENKDLFWAIRGAGHNFGVVTQATIKVYPQQNKGNHVNGDLVFTADKLEAFYNLLNAQNPLPAPLSIFSLFLKLDPAAAPVILVNMVYAGPEAEGRAIIAKFSALGTVSTQVAVVPWNKLSDTAALGLGNAVCARGNRKNMFGMGLKKINVAAMRDIFNTFSEMLRNYPDTVASAITIESFSVQGVQAFSDASSAYPHRDITNHVLLNMAYNDASIDNAITNYSMAIRAKFQANTGFPTLKTYMNYGRGDEPIAVLYGQSKLQTLGVTKKKYDPSGVFNAYHAIPARN